MTSSASQLRLLMRLSMTGIEVRLAERLREPTRAKMTFRSFLLFERMQLKDAEIVKAALVLRALGS